eukprot:gnl/MRDRNA2_/MRDRNA2_185811_c0_seq1.p1 gnl/MRDRNA2_/MRDRNA2_185811_c0~~gnl/MRDRNA2_/MRDRNA2_185811_c0_seq1.p1  ORF type:complete len:152 (-),score=24.17 gnl/MRDRNA2_/MRDRNA2_185811_c0_seq1:75-473(-)
MGLFTKRLIHEGELIGRYPGHVLSRSRWRVRKGKGLQGSKDYSYILVNGNVLDPTLTDGSLPDEVTSLGGFFGIPTLLCRINEPYGLPGAMANANVSEAGSVVTFTAFRQILAGEEIFIDYGEFYDRSGYSQ